MGMEQREPRNAAAKTQSGSTPRNLDRWNDRRAALERGKEALALELAQVDAMTMADLGGGLVARLQADGSLSINLWHPIPETAAAALRDFLCEMLGAPAHYADVAGVTTLSKEQAQELAANLTRRAIGNSGRHDTIAIDVRTAIFDALDHVGVVQFEPRKADGLDDHRNRDAALGLDLGAEAQDPEPFDECTGAFPIRTEAGTEPGRR